VRVRWGTTQGRLEFIGNSSQQGRQTIGGGHGFGAKPVCAQRTAPAAGGSLALPFHIHLTSEAEAILFEFPLKIDAHKFNSVIRTCGPVE
jgi:hypothetical protein